MDKINVICKCGKSKTITERCFDASVRKYGSYKCLGCIIRARGSKNGDGMRRKMRNLVGHLNSDIIDVCCSKCKSSTDVRYKSLKQWGKRHDNEYICGACLNRSQDRSLSKSVEHRSRCSFRSKENWQRPEYREKLVKHLAEVRSLGPGPSNLERAVWRYLDDLGVKFTSARDGKSFTLGPWSFDIKIDKSEVSGASNHLLIEVDGFYRHNRQDVIHYDAAKEEFVNRYHTNYKLIRILEHEFLAPGRLKNRLDNLINGKAVVRNSIDLSDLTIEMIDFSIATPFLGAYHYLGFVNKRGIPIGCLWNGELIGVALFAGLTRKESSSRLGLKQKECRELIRFCISPNFHNKNLGSWFLSRSIRKLSELIDDVKLIVTFADSSVGHTGALYKATNFEFDGTCGDSYCWLGSDGWIMHKKTMWDHSRKNGLSEVEMANKSGYVRLDCMSKSRFLYWIDKEARDKYKMAGCTEASFSSEEFDSGSVIV